MRPNSGPGILGRAARSSLVRVCATLAFLAGAGACSAQSRGVDQLKAQDILGERVKGSNYRVLPEVGSNGRNRIWRLKTNYGDFTVTSDALLEVRLRELDVLAKLEETSFGEKAITSLGQSVAAPLIFGGELLTSPVETLKGTFGGIGQMFDRLSTSGEKGASNESFAGGVFGVDSARRRIAAELDVDPHTDFPPLAERLSHLASGSALGSMTVGAAMKLAVPGTMALSFSGVTASKSVKDALREKTAGQLLRDAREKMKEQGVAPEIAESLTANRNYTPTDLYVIAAALERLDAGNTDLFVYKAARAETRSSAYLLRLQADMMASRSGRAARPIEFLAAPGITLIRTARNEVLAFVPADEFLWTKDNAKAAEDVHRYVVQNVPDATKHVILAGTPGEQARYQLEQRGWTVEEISLRGTGPDASAEPPVDLPAVPPLPPIPER